MLLRQFRAGRLDELAMHPAVAALDGRSIDRFCAEEIFEPLGMTSAHFELADALREKRRHRLTGNGRKIAASSSYNTACVISLRTAISSQESNERTRR